MIGLINNLNQIKFVSLSMFDVKTVSTLKIRAKLLRAARCWLDQNDYVEVHGPTLIPAVGDWPGSFEVKYFDKKAYLTQGLQPYAYSFLANFGKIYTIAPAFRAEKVNSKRHLTEYWRIEVAQKCDLDTIIGIQEELVAYVCNSLSKEAKGELEYLSRRAEDLEKVHAPFPRLTYNEVIDMLQKDEFNVSWGQNIDLEMENHFSLKFKQPFFVTEFPIGVQTFFYKSHAKRPELTLSVDLVAPEGYGEISGGGQMIDEKEVLLTKMAEEKIEPGDQQWYMNFMQYGSVPQSGFAIGLERLVQWICKLAHIRDASAFPRLFDGIYP
jgi:asparaginyl-tRNA synthetase